MTWRAVDNAGNSRDGFWTFRVVDAAAPVLSDAAPVAGSSSELRRPLIAFMLSDVGTGVDPLTLRVLLDGIDVAPAGAFDGTRFTFVPATDLAFGSHELRVLAADRSGNPLAPTAWTFRVADLTAPTLGDPRPDAGSSSSDRTPVISVAAFDVGTGVDPATVAVTLDGRDVSRLGTFSGGRFTYQPQELLALGDHVVVARVSDRAGNPAAPFEWHFGVRDEAAPTVDGRLPAPGATVPGAAVIGFDVADAGSGIDSASLRVAVDGSDVTAWGTFDGSPVPLRAGQPRCGRPHDRGDRRRPLGQRRRPGDVAVRRRQPGDRPPGRCVRADPAGVRPARGRSCSTRRRAASRWPARGCWSPAGPPAARRSAPPGC